MRTGKLEHVIVKKRGRGRGANDMREDAKQFGIAGRNICIRNDWQHMRAVNRHDSK